MIKKIMGLILCGALLAFTGFDAYAQGKGAEFQAPSPELLKEIDILERVVNLQMSEKYPEFAEDDSQVFRLSIPLPEMTLRASAVVPPMVLLGAR